MDLAGIVLDGRYLVIEPIAEGAMGVVYRAERLKLGRIVAIKVLHDELPDEMASRKRFEIEAMAMARLEHPHCAAVVDVGIHESKPYVVMDFVSGENLRSLTAQGPVPPARAVELMRQVLSGLAHAHELGIVHRDIKPANIVLSQKAGLGDHVKILDFGLARFSQQASRLTVGIAVGTPAYMAPEQCNGGAIDARTDLYACGVMLYELLTGEKPFHSLTDDPVEVVRMHLFKAPPRLDPSFGDLADIVAKALAKNPDDRFQTAEAFGIALRSRLASQPAIPLLDASQPVAIPPGPASQPMAIPPGPASQPMAIPPGPASQPVAIPPGPASQPVAIPPDPLLVSQRMPRVPQPFRPTGKQLAIGGGGLLLLIVLIASLAGRGGRHAAGPGDAGLAVVTPPPAPPPPGGDAADEALSRADVMVSGGRIDEAIKLLATARLTFPTNPRLPLLAGKLYFGKLWFSDGLTAFRAAVKNDPALASDPELAKTVLRGFITTARYDAELAGFLHDVMGPTAAPLLAETAQSHPNAIVRARAAAELKRYH